MKRAISLLLIMLFALSLCACNLDFSAQIESISDSIFNQVVEIGGGLLKEDTSSGDDYNYDDELLESDSATQSTNTTTETETSTETETTPEPEEPDEPEVPQGPSLILYERTRLPLNNFIGLNLTSDNHKDAKNTYGAVRLYRDFDSFASDSVGYGYFYLNNVSPVVHLDAYDYLADMNDQKILDMSKKLYDFAVTYSGNAIFNINHVELGTAPDVNISAQDYATLINACYDGANGTLGDGYGFAGLDPEMKLISGQLSTLNIEYIRNVMTEISKQRTDGFLPIGGWSFKYQSSRAPEGMYLNDAALNALLEYRDTEYPNMEIHLSSFGWDTVNEFGDYYVAPYNTYSSEEMQCAYILRAYMILNGMGVDRATLSTFKDTESDGCGIVASDGTKKVAFEALTAFKQISKGMYFKGALENGADNIYSYLFESEDGGALYGMWTTGTDATYTLPDLSGYETVTAYTYDATSGTFVEGAVSMSELTLTVMPTFILAK